MQRTATPLTSVRFRSQPPNMNILITGSSGFIGYHLTKYLLEKGHNVTGLDNHNSYYNIDLKKLRNRKLQHKNFIFHKLDINNLQSIEGSFDCAINLAAQAGVRSDKSLRKQYVESNINGFKNFLNFCEDRSIKKVIYASSSSVYCDQNRSKFDETDTALEPKSFYAETKLMNEKYAENFSLNNRKVVIGLRFFSVYGPYGRPDMAYYSFTESILKNKKIILYNNGLMSRDMTYIDDIIIGINQVIKYMQNFDGSHHEIFNLGNGTPVTTSDLLGTIEKKLEKKALVIHKTSMNESKFTCANLNKSKKHLKYLPKTKFNNGIDRFINWYLKYGKF